MKRLGYRCVVALSLCMWGSACQETGAPPTAPSTLPSNKVGVLTVACPMNLTVQSLDGANVRVDYPPPQTTGGQEPVSVSCAPEAGTSLPVGTTPGRCEASDALGQSVACSFSIQVLRPPRISRTRFLAFGDSLTAGETSAAFTTLLEPSKSYPFKLQQQLALKYPTQTIDVVNAGLPGERATEGVGRIGGQVSAVGPEVVLIMEGTNDVVAPVFSLAATTQALDGMVREVRARGSDAMIATLPPSRLETAAPRIPQLNDAIRSIAFGNGVKLVDVFSAMATGSCVGPSVAFSPPGGRLPFAVDFPCIGNDDLHPTTQGYEVMADAFFRAIVAEYDVEIAGARASLRSPLGRER